MIRALLFAVTFVLAGVVTLTGDELGDESATFDLKALAESVKQVESLKQYSDNEFLLDDETAALNKSIQRFQGVTIAWPLPVQQVRRDAVYLQGVVKSPSRIYFVEEVPAEAKDRPLSEVVAAIRQPQPLFHSYSVFKIGSTIEPDLARRLRANDKVTVRGEIARVGIEAGRLIVVVSKTKVTNTKVAGAAEPHPATFDRLEVDHKSPLGSALTWLASHQSADGSWSFEHRGGGECAGRCPNPGTLTTGPNAATAMALLALLGAGETHKKGKHKEVISRGLSFLTENAARQGATASFVEPGGTMYSHGLCTITLCEAYHSSGDEELREIAESALNFIVEAQDPVGGGWRYMPRQPGDTSVSGWQMAALHAGRMAGLDVPEKTVAGAARFLDAVQSDGGAKYGYTTPGAGVATTAIGLLSRLRFGWERNHEAIERGVQYLRNRGPSERDLYYNFHASQVLFHYGGEPWQEWQERTHALLVEGQSQEGHQAGSWSIPGSHGAERGGRLYCTSLAALTLEIYYRQLAIFRLSQENEQQAKE